MDRCRMGGSAGRAVRRQRRNSPAFCSTSRRKNRRRDHRYLRGHCRSPAGLGHWPADQALAKMMKRPLIAVALFYLGGILAAGLLPLSPAWPWGMAMGTAVVGLVWARMRCYLIFTLVFFTGWTNSALRTAALSPYDLRKMLAEKPALAVLRGKLCETPTQRVFIQDQKESWRSLAHLDITAAQLDRQPWQAAAGRVAVSTPGLLTNVFAGQTV